MVIFVAFQQSFLVGMETCMLFVAWSYQQRLRAFQPVMPLQEPLLALFEGEDSSSSCDSSPKLLLPITVNPLASLWDAQRWPGPLRCQSSRWQWRWERLETSDDCASDVEEPDRTCTLLGPGGCGWDGKECGEGADVSAHGEASGEGANGLVDIKIEQPGVCQMCGHCTARDGAQCTCSAGGSWSTGDTHRIGCDERVYVSIVF